MTELENERAIDLAAERVWEARRARAQVIAPHLLGEPGWDMMIDLFIAERQGRVSLVKSVCLASGVPYTTAWRWLRVLEREGLVRLTSDSKDLRRVVVRISESGYAKMFDYFQMMVRDNRCAA
ncbi:transcriptional regulator [Novosphingobium piscinae]|uniref:Winged helix DNA-binding protein n=2 Tax=Novosphingobium piscinae TaxID=1507448 RepID=A0A7X1G099_9SPHN|nr:winged helix DNA-binding protein [Novosphingobium piscinae]